MTDKKTDGTKIGMNLWRVMHKHGVTHGAFVESFIRLTTTGLRNSILASGAAAADPVDEIAYHTAMNIWKALRAAGLPDDTFSALCRDLIMRTGADARKVADDIERLAE